MLVPQTEIIVRIGDVEFTRKTVTPGEYVIGRDPECDVPLEVELISRRHARLTVNYDHALIEDLGSSNGTIVGGKPVTESVRIWPNQKIEIGHATIEVRRVKETSAIDLSLAPDAAVLREALPEEFLRDKKYEIGGVVAQGGMGAILDAREATTGRTVAVKVMLRSGSAEHVMRFITEAKITARLEHPNIVPVHELSVDENDQAFYTMKFVRGETLREVLDKLREGDKATLAKFPLATLLTVFQKVCDALAFAHSKGVIHRDLKPANLMLGDYGEVLVMDWGLAKMGTEDWHTEDTQTSDLAPLVTMEGRVLGTPQYMSPEQARGETSEIDTRTDIYALGAILYQIFALCPAVRGKSAFEVLDKVSRGAITPLNEAVAESPQRLRHLPGGQVPESLDAVVRKAMALDPDARYPKVEALQADVTAYQNGFATKAEKAGLGKHLVLFFKRHKAVSIAVIASIVLLAGVTTAFTVRVLIERNAAISAKIVAENERKNAENSLGIADKERNRAEGALGTAESERNRAESALGTAETERKNAESERNAAQLARNTAEDQRKRAEQALADLKKTAPTFAALAKSLLEEGKFNEAIEKAGYAIQLDESNPDNRLFRANLLEATQELGEAAGEYRHVLALRPDDESAKLNLDLCEQLLAENGGELTLRKELQKKLLIALRGQKRLIEAGPLSAVVEPDLVVAEAAIRGRLREYRKQPGWDDSRLSRNSDGTFNLNLDNLVPGDLSALKGQPISELSLSYTSISDLSRIAGFPLKHLILNYAKAGDLSPLHGIPLESLDMIGMPVADLSPLEGMRLRHLNLSRTQVSDLRPLAGMPLEYISTNNTRVADITTLRGMPLRYADFSASHVSDLAPLAGAPLTYLDISYNQISGLKPLAACLKLQRLFLSHTAVNDLEPLAKLRLKELDFSDTNVTGLSPLRDQPLQKLKMDNTFVSDFSPLATSFALEEIVIPADAMNVEPLRHVSLLHFISAGSTGGRPSQTAAEFWKAYDEKKRGRK
jgi:serine/threonine protein kinase/Leucine-rich repeat (LRR) protein